MVDSIEVGCCRFQRHPRIQVRGGEAGQRAWRGRGASGHAPNMARRVAPGAIAVALAQAVTPLPTSPIRNTWDTLHRPATVRESTRALGRHQCNRLPPGHQYAKCGVLLRMTAAFNLQPEHVSIPGRQKRPGGGALHPGGHPRAGQLPNLRGFFARAALCSHPAWRARRGRA